MSSASQDAIRKELSERLESLVKPDCVSLDEMVELILPYLQADSKFTLTPLSGGSSCQTLLLITNPGHPTIIKCGRREDIKREVDALRRCQFPPRFRQIMKLTPKYRNTGFASFASYLVGNCDSAKTLRDCVLDPRYRAYELVKLLRQISIPLLSWGGRSTEPGYFYSKFPWKKNISKISQHLTEFGSKNSTKADAVKKLIEIANGRQTWSIPKPGLLNRSISNTHGDLNCTNILVGIPPNGISSDVRQLEPYVIDFESMNSGDYSWTLDWARLEIYLKLFTLRNCTDSAQLYRNLVREINDNCEIRSNVQKDDVSPTHKCRALVKAIRQICYDNSLPDADTTIEYLYNLLCWNLSYIDSVRFEGDDSDYQDIVIDCALHTLDQLNSYVKSLDDPPDYRSAEMPEVKGPLYSGVSDIAPGISSTIKVLSGWSEANSTIGNASTSLLIIDSIYSEYGVLNSLLNNTLKSDAVGLMIEVFMMDPLRIFGAQRLREFIPQSASNIGLHTDVTEQEKGIYRGGLDYMTGRLMAFRPNSKVYVYPTMPAVRQIVVDNRHHFFGWFPLFAMNPGFPCLYLDAWNLRRGDSVVLDGLKKQAKNVRDVSKAYETPNE